MEKLGRTSLKESPGTEEVLDMLSFEMTVKNLKIHVHVEEEFESRNINCMSFK